MTRIAGVSTQTNSKGMVTKITVDLKRHPLAKELLAGVGLIKETNAEKMIRTGNYTSIEEARKQNIDHLKKLWNK